MGAYSSRSSASGSSGAKGKASAKPQLQRRCSLVGLAIRAMDVKKSQKDRWSRETSLFGGFADFGGRADASGGGGTEGAAGVAGSAESS